MALTLGERLTNIRYQYHDNLEEFGARVAEQIGGKQESIDSITVAWWESDRREPNATCLKALAELGKMSIDVLIYGEFHNVALVNWLGVDEDGEPWCSACDEYLEVDKWTYCPYCGGKIVQQVEE